MSLANNKKSFIVAVVAMLIGACIFIYWAINTTPKEKAAPAETLKYVFAKTDINEGDIIKAENIELKDSVVTIPGAFTKETEVVGQAAKKKIAPAEIIMPAFLIAQDKIFAGKMPQNGFGAVPIIIKKSVIPPYVKAGQVFDMFTMDNTIKIENVKVLDILDQPQNDKNKMFILQIKNTDDEELIEALKDASGFIFIQKNEEEIGEYKFTNINKKKIAEAKKELESALPSKLPDSEIPPVEDIIDKLITDEQNGKDVYGKKEVEIVVGNQKTKMEFSD